MVDVFAEADPAYLDDRGITAPVQHIPPEQAQSILADLGGIAEGNLGPVGPRCVVASDRAVFSSGGAAANVAKIAAMLNVGAAFSGCVGTDEPAALFEKDLRAAGVVPFLKKGAGKTGLCFTFNCESHPLKPKTYQRSGTPLRLAASPGASFEFTEADVNEDLISGAGAIVLDGYILERRPLVERILHLADERGIPVALDAASVFQIREKTEALLHYSRNFPLIVFMNADESIVFFNTIRKGSASVDAVDEREKESLILKEICPVLKCITEGEIFPVIVIKLGGRGAVVLAGGNIYREETFTIIPRDTVGAGDAFCAAFISAWIRGKTIRECAALGNKVAREILMVPGTRIKAEKLRSFAKALNAG
jgi:sugar/nucleoside kinase (ribokinase family)